jgi:hypothetical protein
MATGRKLIMFDALRERFSKDDATKADRTVRG